RVAFLQQLFPLTGQDLFTSLVVDGNGDGDDPGRALWRQRGNFQHRVERVAGKDRLQEFRGLLDKSQQRVADRVGEAARPRGGEAQDLEAVGERRRQTALPAIFDIVMDRVVVDGEGLKRDEM